MNDYKFPSRQLKRREFNQILKSCFTDPPKRARLKKGEVRPPTPPRYLDIEKLKALDADTRAMLGHHIVRNRGPVLVELAEAMDDSWLNGCGYLYTTKQQNPPHFTFRHTCEHQINPPTRAPSHSGLPYEVEFISTPGQDVKPHFQQFKAFIDKEVGKGRGWLDALESRFDTLVAMYGFEAKIETDSTIKNGRMTAILNITGQRFARPLVEIMAGAGA